MSAEERWVDKHGDVWTFDADGIGHSFETADFPREHVEKKWGPLRRADGPQPVHGMCTACGSVEVRLDKATGTRDLSSIGEHEAYPTGYGCELCS